METAKPKTKTGRPPKLASEPAAVVLEYVRNGCPRRFAASAACIGRSTLMRWIARGKAERKGQFRDFCDALKKAEAEAVYGRLERINAAAEKGTWQAAAWFLERRYPDEFSSDKRAIRELAEMVPRLTSKSDTDGASGK
jgi:hypothetical protein